MHEVIDLYKEKKCQTRCSTGFHSKPFHKVVVISQLLFKQKIKENAHIPRAHTRTHPNLGVGRMGRNLSGAEKVPGGHQPRSRFPLPGWRSPRTRWGLRSASLRPGQPAAPAGVSLHLLPPIPSRARPAVSAPGPGWGGAHCCLLSPSVPERAGATYMPNRSCRALPGGQTATSQTQKHSREDISARLIRPGRRPGCARRAVPAPQVRTRRRSWARRAEVGAGLARLARCVCLRRERQ